MIDTKSPAYGEGVCAYGRGVTADGCLYARGSVKWGQWREGWMVARQNATLTSGASS